MLGKVFKAYDIRATYPDPLDEAMAWQIGFGTARYLLEDAEVAGESTPMMKNIVVGRDMRSSSPALRDALCRGIIDGGANVIDIGMVDTPLVYFAINHLDCAGGVQVTASHNPPRYNGFKVSRRKARPVGETTGLAEIRRYAATVDPSLKGAGAGRIDARDLWDAYRDHVFSFLETKGRKIKVVIDASNGMAGTMVPKVFGKKGAGVPGLEIVELYFDNSKGEFVHEPNPLVAANLRDLQKKVVEERADFGVCFDGDADRLMLVDEASSAATTSRGFSGSGSSARIPVLRSSTTFVRARRSRRPCSPPGAAPCAHAWAMSFSRPPWPNAEASSGANSRDTSTSATTSTPTPAPSPWPSSSPRSPSPGNASAPSSLRSPATGSRAK